MHIERIARRLVVKRRPLLVALSGAVLCFALCFVALSALLGWLVDHQYPDPQQRATWFMIGRFVVALLSLAIAGEVAARLLQR